MKILIAPDSFKDSLKAAGVAKSIKEGFSAIVPKSEFSIIPMADGGEGTVESVIDATSGTIYKVKVHDPLMRATESFFGITGDGSTAVIEMAAASGIEKLTREERNPWVTTTYGTGELIKLALEKGVKKIIIGIGGSATNDCGAGMAQALGVKLLDSTGNEIEKGGGALRKVSSIDISGIDAKIRSTEIQVACDVTNPLTGEKGASHVYGPQKGADKDMVLKLDENLKHFASIILQQTGKDILEIPGSGAAGGLGGGLMAFLDATLMKGFDIIANAIELEQKIQECDLVITGEGKIDFQTQYGKTIFGVSRLAKKHHKPVIVIAGTVADGAEIMYEKGVDAIFSIVDKPMPLDEALKNAPKLLAKTGERIARLLQFRI